MFDLDPPSHPTIRRKLALLLYPLVVLSMVLAITLFSTKAFRILDWGDGSEVFGSAIERLSAHALLDIAAALPMILLVGIVWRGAYRYREMIVYSAFGVLLTNAVFIAATAAWIVFGAMPVR
jgi:hypothetical protein